VVNKADRPGADRLAHELEMMLHLRSGQALRGRAGHHGVAAARIADRRSPIDAARGGRTSRRDTTSAGNRTPANATFEDDRTPPGDAAPMHDGGKGTGAHAGRGEGKTGQEDAGKAASRRARSATTNAGDRRSAIGDREEGQGGAAWEIPVLRTSAQNGDGIDELLAAVETHRAWLDASGELGRRRRRRMAERVRDVVRRALMSAAWSDGDGARILDEAMPELEAGTTTPYAVAARIVRAVTG